MQKMVLYFDKIENKDEFEHFLKSNIIDNIMQAEGFIHLQLTNITPITDMPDKFKSVQMVLECYFSASEDIKELLTQANQSFLHTLAKNPYCTIATFLGQEYNIS